MPTNCTIVAVQDGDWNVATTWSPQRIPADLDKVCIPAGRIVRVKGTQYTKIVDCPTSITNPNIAIFICGTLDFDASGTLYLGFNSLIQVLDPVGPTTGLIKASNGNSDLIKFGCVLKWNGTYDINGPYYIGPVDEGPGVLPVVFGHFKAEQKQPFTVNLEWSTLQEVNNSSFVIERSNDKKTWSAIGSVASEGNSYTKNNYTYVDNVPEAGNNYYRLRQVDLNGQVSFSETVRIVHIIKKNISIFPNPVNAAAQLYTKEAFKPGQAIQLIDAKGTRLKTVNPTGGNRVQIEMNGMAAGLYLIQLMENGRIIESVSVIKQ
ncbi:T9SS type A sorting domain-containing protein [Lacibacter sp. H407]|uniref:T9SS type A sorting domain-containing protein n=1 Tax=Lacibacter sp. H407 TaxID=3133423 RepID=UPI0030BD2077